MRASKPENEDRPRHMLDHFPARMPARLATGKEAGAYFRYRLLEETQRSTRHNHYCSVLVLRSTDTDPGDVHHRVASLTRRTDVVGLVEMDSESNSLSRAVGAILPETGPGGCETLIARLKDSLPNMRDVSFGWAVFPGDSTEPRSLLAIAGQRVA